MFYLQIKIIFFKFGIRLKLLKMKNKLLKIKMILFLIIKLV